MIGIIILTGLGLILSIILVLVDKRLNKEDTKVKKIRDLLPGYNCGACGYGSCDGMAKLLSDNLSGYEKCKLLRGDAREELEKYLKK